ncbi:MULTISPECIES: N-acetylmuramoyl-L-alanine amidase [unclassified Fusibacter]|uniref:N-acetylmuramoyl-L-alanine amidase n=1 Tax=unclassified Fusibacter TaxID=2624464 RepID=UPI00101255BF|nr:MULTISPECIES: N-acetylmuramoyl-L-alanine amidase [unclassified Fusibacter]MCK8060280.1 N-acetylmuramoyl-L-alanine amidase [Fusibacter sp. A2]NPE20431.1 N-acetylmuramoyl-L-alanine amidase [Fusibacter sp. A1]RXV63636.1 N-acetylmuramoyl-L-alanine amidase [Fusibacter sp. A1]
MKKQRSIQIVLLIIGIGIGLLVGKYLWDKGTQKAEVPKVVVEAAIEQQLEWQTSKVMISDKWTDEDETKDYLLEFELLNSEYADVLAVSAVEYRLAQIGSIVEVQYLYDPNTSEISHLQWLRNPQGQLNFTYDRPLVVLDAGHGGLDEGEGNSDLFIEKEMNLKMTLRMEELLKAAGINVVLTRDTDDYVSNLTRAELANYIKPDLFISNHINKYNEKTSGIEVHYSQLSDREFAQTLAQAIASEDLKVLRVINRRGDTPEFDYYFMHKYIDSPSYIIEYGFADHEGDAVYISDHWESLVENAANAIIVYLSLTEK